MCNGLRLQAVSLQKKSIFIKIEQIHYPFKNALWALRPCKAFGRLSRHPCRNPKPLPRVKGCVCLVGSASCRAFGHTRPASVPGLSVGLPPHQARTLAVSRTQSLHDAVTPTTDNPHWGYPKARMLWLLAKSFARCKTSRASNAKHPFSKIYRFFNRLNGLRLQAVTYMLILLLYTAS